MTEHRHTKDLRDVDWWALVRESFEVCRRGRTLWALAVVSLVQSGILLLLLAVLLVPSLATALSLASPSDDLGLSGPLAETVAIVAEHRVAWVISVIVLFCVWAASGVLDVAATSGTIAQTVRIADRQQASFSAGIEVGFSVWWRVVGVLAIAAAPALVAVLVAALGLLFLVTVPLSRGIAPDPLQLYVGVMLQTGVNVIAGAATVPLAVLANLGMRTIVIRGAGWKAGWRDAAELARRRLLDVLIAFVIVMGANLALEVLLMFAAAVIALVVGGVLAAVPAASSGVLSVAAVLGLCAGAAFFVAVSVWQSVVWTLFWRRARLGGQSAAAGVS